MPDDDLRHFPSQAPETEDDWRRLHRAAFRADQAWPIVRPMSAFVTNWKAWVFAIALMAALRRSEVAAILDLISGAGR